ncbi:MAG: hypothetical protein KAH38_09415 [Candidatus Hydrogenedentes bacterium]|nr:hypothetical protein [Candidatus Hydrogenedentota bacterium]
MIAFFRSIFIFIIVCYSAQSESAKTFTLEQYNFLREISCPQELGERACNGTGLSSKDKDSLSHLYGIYNAKKIAICNNMDMSEFEDNLQFQNIFEVLFSQLIYERISLRIPDMNESVVCILRHLDFLFDREEVRWDLTYTRFQEFFFDIIYSFDILHYTDRDVSHALFMYLQKQNSSTRIIEGRIGRHLDYVKSEVNSGNTSLWGQLVGFFFKPSFQLRKEAADFEMFCEKTITQLGKGKGYDTYVPYSAASEKVDIALLTMDITILKYYRLRNKGFVLLWALAVYEYYDQNGRFPSSLADINFVDLFGSNLIKEITQKSYNTGLPIEYVKTDNGFVVRGGPEYTLSVERERKIKGETIYFGCVDW